MTNRDWNPGDLHPTNQKGRWGSPRRLRRRRGFILVTTLFVLAIVGVLLTQLARYSVNEATESILVRRELERKWTMASCQRYVLGNASRFLRSESEQPLANANSTLVLGEQQYDFFVADESAKLDLNFALGNTTELRLQKVVKDFADVRSNVKLSPLAKEHQNIRNDAFESWGQVFKFSLEEQEPSSKVFLATQKLTCWSRQLNIKSADPKVFEIALKFVVSAADARRILEDIQESGVSRLNAIVEKNVGDQQKKRTLLNYLKTNSISHSVWIRAKSPYDTKTTLTVREGYTQDIKRTYNFSWPQ